MQRGDNVCAHHSPFNKEQSPATHRPTLGYGAKEGKWEGGMDLSVVEEGAGERRRRFTEARLRKKRGAEWTDYSH